MTTIRTKALVYEVAGKVHVLIDTLDEDAVRRQACALWPGAGRELVDVEVRIGPESIETEPAPAMPEGAPV